MRGMDIESGFPLEQAPSFKQGWGRVDLIKSLRVEGNDDSPPTFYARESVLTDNDETVVPSYEGACVEVTNSALQEDIWALTFTLAWSDPSDDVTTGSILNNDLDLQLYKWNYDTGTSQFVAPLIGNDRTNNVEKIVWSNPEVGERYFVRVSRYGELLTKGVQKLSLIHI